ncbi:OsmC family protein [Mesobacillus zeae]|uniref:OsmC family peroxiredoxin n=1 Tax=Mesobacillus zeae TaxID=1917180 RepID=A0A398B8M0_9BACI|nr:OsmC family protein [Mesobacillus zeae]RID85178.1 OsmC family peroxiredoxin [Mesobacillus zeae]
MEFHLKEAEGFYTDLEYGRLEVAGSAQQGFKPSQLLVSSVAVCSGGVLRTVLEKMRLAFSDIHISAREERSGGVGSPIEKIQLHFIIKGIGLPTEKIEKAMKFTTRNCPIVQSLQGSIEVDKTFEIVDGG